jgi:hypothetical protein
MFDEQNKKNNALTHSHVSGRYNVRALARRATPNPRKTSRDASLGKPAQTLRRQQRMVM